MPAVPSPGSIYRHWLHVTAEETKVYTQTSKLTGLPAVHSYTRQTSSSQNDLISSPCNDISIVTRQQPRLQTAYFFCVVRNPGLLEESSEWKIRFQLHNLPATWCLGTTTLCLHGAISGGGGRSVSSTCASLICPEEERAPSISPTTLVELTACMEVRGGRS